MLELVGKEKYKKKTFIDQYLLMNDTKWTSYTSYTKGYLYMYLNFVYSTFNLFY